ncbi:uncharacterized protein BDV17DRAFT_286118 [Aspergillus undulatus]|uniref:uncharacterized protein n=1 Tax=Aspergillus undulatus TaxID=1810928 RepID=UPI003CCD8A39
MSKARYHFVPKAHFRLGLGKYLLLLHCKSAFLWWLPDFTALPPSHEDPHLMLSNDPRLQPYRKGAESGQYAQQAGRRPRRTGKKDMSGPNSVLRGTA